MYENEFMLLMEWLCCDVISGAAHGSCESKVNWKPAGLGNTVVKINSVLWNQDSVMATWDSQLTLRCVSSDISPTLSLAELAPFETFTFLGEWIAGLEMGTDLASWLV